MSASAFFLSCVFCSWCFVCFVYTFHVHSQWENLTDCGTFESCGERSVKRRGPKKKRKKVLLRLYAAAGAVVVVVVVGVAIATRGWAFSPCCAIGIRVRLCR